ncbi:MAG: hypothetical protein ACI35O_15620 [Bacillaceae bacterium]
MDKQSSKITIKINGKEKGYSEKGETDRQEQQTFPWVLPTNQALKQKISQDKNFSKEVERKKPKKKFKVHKSVPAVIVAVIIGCLFGFILLNITGKNSLRNEAVPALERNAGVNEAVTIRPLQFYGLQGGVYSSQKSALEEQRLFEEKGVATAIIHQEDKWFLLLGTFDKKEKSVAFQQILKEKGINTFGKIFIVNGGQGKGAEGTRLATQQLFLEKLINGEIDQKMIDSFKKNNDEKAFLVAVEQYMNVKDSDDKEKVQGALLKLVEMYSTLKK